MIRLDGKVVAESLRENLRNRVEKLKIKSGRAPQLTVVLIGENRASQVYVKNKHLACQKVGIDSVIIEKPGNLTQAELENLLQNLNANKKVDGVLVQLPLPALLKSERIFELLSPEKDADGLTYASTGLLWSGKAMVRPCTPSGVIQILKHYKIEMAGKKAVVIGRSQIVGKPMAALLLEENATVSICHSGTRDIRFYTREADLVVVAAGKAGLFGKEDFKKGSVIVDVGMHGTGGGKLCGDVRFEELEGWAAAATPVPGGVGPMTIAMLLENTVFLAERKIMESK